MQKIYTILYRVVAFAKYYWRAQTKYDVHSPFVFDFIQNAFEEKKWYYTFGTLQDLRYELEASNEIIEVTDFGAGSQVLPTKKRKIGAIAKSSLSSPFFCQLLFSIVQWQKPKNVLELGTSLGLSALHLAAGSRDTDIYTLEGCPNIAHVAQTNFDTFDAKNIHLIVGRFDLTLQPTLETVKTIDLAIIDGNHQKQATIDYFEQLLKHIPTDACLIFDDIYWSKDMEAAWQYIKNHPSVTISIDTFQYGLVFFRKEKIEKEHFTLIPAYWKPWRMGFF